MSQEIEPDLPPENGRRAHVRRNGEVRGSGAGAGGSNPGEDFDNEEQGGDGFTSTGASPLTKGAPGQGAGDRD